MAFEVLLTADAVQDLDEITTWIAQNDNPSGAEHVLERIEAALTNLSKFPKG